MLRALLILCVLCTASWLVVVKGHPGKMRILPGLTFYHTDDNIGGTQSLNEEDRNLLNTVMKIVSSEPMQRVLADLENTLQNRGDFASGKPPGPQVSTGGTGLGGSQQLAPIGSSSNLDLSSQISGGSSAVSGMPIATINVYPGYPGAHAINDPSRRMYQPRAAEGPQTLDTSADTYDDDTGNDASPVMEPSYGIQRKYFLGDNDMKDIYNGDDAYANQNYPVANDNYFEASSNFHQLPALDRRSLSKLQQKEDFSPTQLEDVQGQRRLMQYEKPSPVNHFSSLLFPTH